ncbi:sensor histidine kinase [Methylorubrum extorquens]|jgi:two-component system, NtrC family, C4-dicarboxylate transport sensor histidine kinase DctB|uniref:C4-dicarboxylate transport sensor protein DctB n=2 Tax=Methylorubrum extorquens TaxID=408 RepID=C5AX99_METEA|nr:MULTISPECIES: ATP-binding protein [Methylorubrum]MDF9861412.1 two-component system C4-dicarboxylate transport sensor histidine kinase DctB [Methylorubrum pseudosasae]MDH6635038.1 two-component system C4-dicarboxylate transport sensor histidine kinase DctB [Methylobacterium sp. SuP10 SLI 274]MDH6664210.1 two-component system C4-dicarboxylate transport sensor histidine kinase DctB [Methylorubrum zatmanii]ACS38938.1 putative sensor histidine kinase precursor, putative transcriptional regulator 
MPIPRATAARVLILAALAVAAVFAVLKAGEVTEARVAESLAGDARQRAEIYAQSLEGAIERFGFLPAAAALDPRVQSLLAAPDDPAQVATVNAYLQRLSREAGAGVVYLLIPSGLTIAASNWDTPQTYVGQDFSYRPYFTEARGGRTGRFYAIGTLTGVPGYFISAPVVIDGTVRGVVATKVSLDPLETIWREGTDRVLVADENGIVFLASDPALKFRATKPLDAAARAGMERTRQYGRDDYAPIDLGRTETVGGVPLVSRSEAAPQTPALFEEASLPAYGWTLLLFADAAPVAIAGRSARVGAILALVVLGLIGLYGRQHLRRVRENRAAQRALEAAVAARTADLSAANLKLAGEIEERTRAEGDLREAQGELVQAAKMATLGQMAAGITHELNQPLAAMRGLADNASAFLRQGREAEAAANLTRIVSLVDRLGKITGQLRSFSRRSGTERVAVDVGVAVSESLAILSSRIRDAGARVTTDLDPAARWVVFEPIRLSQVLVNLVGNALDAVKGRPGAEVAVRAWAGEGQVVLSVEDNGPGLDAAALARLFEPFFTTKPAGEGLGLGLPISLAIAREFGANLQPRPMPGGGLAFDLVMEVAKEAIKQDAIKEAADMPPPERMRHVS